VEVSFEPPSRFTSFKHLVGAAGQRQRDSDAERLGGLQIQEEFNFGGLLNRQIGWLVALENSSGVSADQTIVFRFTAAIARAA
jgi:ribosomal protein L27